MKFDTLKTFKNAAVWKDYKDTKQLKFAPKTLIYGFNGSGKTTLSRAFYSIQAEKLAGCLPDETEFSFSLSDGRTISSQNLENPFEKSLLVFNEDFVLRNFQWEDSKADGIAYISESSVTKISDLETANEAFDKANTNFEAAQIATGAAKKELEEFQKAIGKRVRDLDISKRYTQQYNRSHVDKDYANREFTDDDLLSEDELKKRQVLLSQDEALPPLKPPFEIDFDLRNWLSNTLVLLSQTPGSTLADEFKEHKSAHTWIKDGLEYHVEHNLETCLFCANPLTQDRKQLLAKSFDDAWDTFSKSIQKTRDECQQYTDKFRAIYQSIPKETELQPAERTAFQPLREEFLDKIKTIGKLLKSISELLEQKKDAPTNSLSLTADFDINTWLQEYEISNSELKKIIARHNTAHEEFAFQQKNAFDSIKHHILAQEREGNTTSKKAYIAAQRTETLAKTKLETTRQNRDKIHNELSNHGIGAEKLNKMIAAYLGHKDIQLNALDIGYQLIRSDGNPATQLSEGEKTALAFCYFLTLFEAENRKKKELVVIIDDPISSLDTSAQTHAFSLLIRMTKNCHQTIILTHNLAFMNMVKGTFKRQQEKQPDREIASFFTLECTCPPLETNNRTTTLTEMNPLLKNYETEYQYLFELVKNSADNKETNQSYLLPNATRKLLEMFTAFSSPSAENFTAALMNHQETFVKKNIELKSLERLVQIESHGTLEGFSNLPALTVEEAIKAAETSMVFINTLAPNHYKEMLKCIEN